MNKLFNLTMLVSLASMLSMPTLVFADIYMEQDNTQQIVLTNLAPDDESTNVTSVKRHQGVQRYIVLFESDFLETKKEVDPRNTLKSGIKSVSRQQITDAVNKAAALTAIDPVLLHAVIQVESNYNPNALSRQGAQGLMQLMPNTAKRFNVQNIYDPAQNILGGALYLRELFNLFNGNMPLILAAYNAGPQAVTKHGMKIPPYNETRLYVPKVLHCYKKLNAEKL